MKKIIKSSFLLFGAGVLSAATAFAQTCTVNGQQVDCAQLGNKIQGVLGWGLGGVLVLFVLALVAAIFWLMMIIHAIRNPIDHKALWILVMLFTGIFGAVIYYFAVKRASNVQSVPAQPMA